LTGAKKTFDQSEMPKYLLLENVKAMVNKNHHAEYQK
jgi:site-specific DNA-cytosine methylase